MISDRADFFEAAESPERMPLMSPLPPETAEVGLSSSCDLDVPVGRSIDISPVLSSLEAGSR